MRRTLRSIGRFSTSAGNVSLRMSVGVHTGTFDFFLVGGSHRELLVAGPAATRTVLMESTATAGEILISPETAASLDPSEVGSPKGEGFLLRREPYAPFTPADTTVWDAGEDLSPFLSPPVRAHLTGGAPEAEHRHLAIAFVEIGAIDELMERSGAGAAAVALDQSVRTIQEACGRHGVTFLESDIASGGVKVLLIAGAPVSTGRDDEAMLRAVRATIDRPHVLPLRIGVNSGRTFVAVFGPPFRRTYSIKSDAVNLAARVMGKAAHGQVLVTDVTLARSSARFEAEPLEPFTVKGKAAPVRASALGAAGGRVVAEDDASIPLVGRERELVELLGALDDATRHRGRVVDIVGEPGIGKSRLVHELTSRAGALTVLVARCEPYESSTPYYPFRLLLRDLLGIADTDPPEAAAQRIARRIEANAPELLPWLPLLAIPLDVTLPPTPETEQLDDEFLRARLAETVDRFMHWVLPTPTVMVFDDVHCMDDASSDLLHRLVAAIGDRPWLICITRREDDRGFRLASDAPALRLELRPLDPGKAVALADAATNDAPIAPHVMEALVERSAGNPLFLRELISAVRATGDPDHLPDTVEELLMAQIDRLPPVDRSMLRYASVLGASFEPELLSDVIAEADAPIDLASWERLREFVDVDEDGGGALRFRHALIRDAAYEGLPYRRRRELHCRVGSALERRLGDATEQQAEVLSFHFSEAHDHDRAWTYSRVAGQRAEQKFALLEAAEFYRRALASARALGSVPRGDLMSVNEALGDVFERLGQYADAGSAYRRARTLAGGDAIRRAQLLLKQAWLPEREGRYPQALRWVTRGYRALENEKGPDAARTRAQLAVWYAAVRHSQARYRDAIRWCHRAIGDARAAGERDALAHAYFLIDWAYVSLGEIEKVCHSDEALRIYEELGDLGRQAAVLNNMGMFAYFEGRWDDAVELYGRGRELRIRVGDTVAAALGTMNIGEVRSDQGWLDEAEELFRQSLRVWTAAGYREMAAITTSNLGRVASRAGRYDEAMTSLERARETFVSIGSHGELLETDARIAECLVLQGCAEEALERSTGALQRAASLGGVHPAVPALHRTRAYALMQMVRLDEANAALEESLRAGRRRKADYEVALTLRAALELASLQGIRPTPEIEDESRAILERLMVAAIATVPLPAGTATTT
jgi:class 3 adenylate cyclase/tetratricopeptide (TPR) repeat protein